MASPEEVETVAKDGVMAAQFLDQLGLVFEINRRILHPLGFSLVVREGPMGKYFEPIHVTEDPRGFVYDPESFKVGEARYQKFLDEAGLDRIEKRVEILGFTEQLLIHANETFH